MQEGLMITGQVGLVRKSRHPVSRIIEWVTRCDTSHVIIATSEVQCISAEPGGTRRRLISDYPRITWSQYVLTDRQAHLIAGIAEYTIGVRYDYLACAAHAIAAITHTDTPPAVQRWLANRAPTTCSALAQTAITAAGLKAPTPWLPTPKDWALFYETRGWNHT
jgi:hypothetical protein